jgi:hypothetical protein
VPSEEEEGEGEEEEIQYMRNTYQAKVSDNYHFLWWSTVYFS